MPAMLVCRGNSISVAVIRADKNRIFDSQERVVRPINYHAFRKGASRLAKNRDVYCDLVGLWAGFPAASVAVLGISNAAFLRVGPVVVGFFLYVEPVSGDFFRWN